MPSNFLRGNSYQKQGCGEFRRVIFSKNKRSGTPDEAFLAKTNVRGLPTGRFYQKQVFGDARRGIFSKNKCSGTPDGAFLAKTSVRGRPMGHF